MSLRKRGGTWWVDVLLPTGSEYADCWDCQQSPRARISRPAQVGAVAIAKFGEKPRRTWNEAVVRWLKEQSHKATAERRRDQFRWLDQHLGRQGTRHHHRAMIDQITDAKLARGFQQRHGKSAAGVVARNSAQMRQRLGMAGPCPAGAHAEGVSPAHTVSGAREEAQRLLAELPEHLADMAEFSLFTGLRRGERHRLDVDASGPGATLAWIDPDQVKPRKVFRCRSNAEPRPSLAKLGKHATHVFSFRGSRSRQVSTKAWY